MCNRWLGHIYGIEMLELHPWKTMDEWVLNFFPQPVNDIRKNDFSEKSKAQTLRIIGFISCYKGAQICGHRRKYDKIVNMGT